MRWYHGTDEQSGNDVMSNGLNEDQWRSLDPDGKGFSLTSNPERARQWADWRTNPEIGPDEGGRPGRGGPMVIWADEKDLPPLSTPAPGEWGDPGERYIPPESFPGAGPGVFKSP